MYRCNVFYSTYNYNTDELKDIGYVPLSLDLGNTLNRVNLDFFETAPYKQELSCAILYNDTIFQYRQDSLSPRFIINALKDKVIPDRILRQLNGSDPMKAGSLLVSSGIFIKNIYESDSYFFILYNGSEPQELIWKTNRNYTLNAGAMFRGNFADVSSALVRAFARARPAPVATFYKGNRVLVIETMEDENAYD